MKGNALGLKTFNSLYSVRIQKKEYFPQGIKKKHHILKLWLINPFDHWLQAKYNVFMGIKKNK
jgi:hypothetical protein